MFNFRAQMFNFTVLVLQKAFNFHAWEVTPVLFNNSYSWKLALTVFVNAISSLTLTKLSNVDKLAYIGLVSTSRVIILPVLWLTCLSLPRARNIIASCRSN